MHECRVLLKRARFWMRVIDRLRERQVEVAVARFGAEVLRRDPLVRGHTRQRIQLVENVRRLARIAACSQQQGEHGSAAHEASMAYARSLESAFVAMPGVLRRFFHGSPCFASRSRIVCNVKPSDRSFLSFSSS